MKKDALLPTQLYLYDLLSSLTALPVYDAVPENATFPYITIGEDTATAIDAKNANADTIESVVHVWSRATGFKQVKEIMAQVIKSVSGKRACVEGYEECKIVLDYRSVYHDPDGITRHGVLRFKFNLYEEDS